MKRRGTWVAILCTGLLLVTSVVFAGTVLGVDTGEQNVGILGDHNFEGWGSPLAADSLNSDEQRLFRLINDYRASKGRSRLALSEILTSAANWKAHDEYKWRAACPGGWAGLHRDSKNRCIPARLKAFGYPSWAADRGREVIYNGSYPDPERALNWWKSSPSHNYQLLHTDVKAMGIARAYRPPGAPYNYVWVVDFGPYVDPIKRPTSLTATAISTSQIRLKWVDNSKYESDFHIGRSPNGRTSWTQIATVKANVTKYTNTGLKCGTKYYYRVRAHRHVDGRYSSFSNVASATTYPCAPAAPSNLSALAASQSQINLSWQDNSNNETGFKIYRDGSHIATVGANVTSYQNTGLTCGTTHSYYVKAYNSGGTSKASNTASATTYPCTPAAPSNLSALAVSQSQIDLSWQDNSDNEDGFKIYRDGSYLTSVGANTTSFQDLGLNCGTTYSYHVTAYNSGGESGASNTASATTHRCLPVVENGSFEQGPAIPKHWKGNKNLTPDDRRVCWTAHDGSCSFRMVGTSARKSLRQVVSVPGNAGDTFTLKGWSKAKNPLPKGGAYCLRARVFHTDGTKGNYRACFAKRTHTWQRKKTTFTAAKDYDKIVVYLLYFRQSGKAWFDDVRLIVH